MSTGLVAIALFPQGAEAHAYRAPLPFKGAPEADMREWARANFDGSRLGVEVDWLDFTEDGAPDALATFFDQDNSGVRGLGFALFRNECGRMRFHQHVEAGGYDVREFEILPGALSFVTTTRRDNDPDCCWTGRQTWRVKLRPNPTDPARQAACGNEQRSFALRRRDLQAFLSSAPALLFPAPETIFHVYPRQMRLEWAPMLAAISYNIEMEYFDPGFDAWQYYDRRTVIDTTSADFPNFVGAQPGRWRVRGIDRLGHESAFSDWRTFEHRR